MSDLWMPGVERHDTGRRLTMRGGPRLFTWHTFEAPYSLTMDRAWRYLRSQKSDPHFVFHPITGQLVQMLPMNTGGRTLRAPGVNTNTHGSVHAQVEVIAYARNPWTDDLTPAGLDGLTRLMDFLRSWGVPDQWAHGVRPPRYPGGSVRRIQPSQSGHFHHAGWVGNDHGDPGAIADPWTLGLQPEPAGPEWETPEHLRAVQQLLNDVTDAGLTVDGVRGPATEAATKHYQTEFRTDLTRDGSPGPATLAALQEDEMTLKELTAKVDRIPEAIAAYRNPGYPARDAHGLWRDAASSKGEVANLAGQIAGLREAVRQLAANPGQPVDLDAVEGAARRGVESAFEDARVVLTTEEN